MALKLNGSTDGSVSIDAPADTSPTGTDVTLTLPTSAGSSGQYLQTNGSGGLSWQTVTDTGAAWTIDTTGTSLTGSSVSVTGIPSTAVQVQVIVRDLNMASDAEWDVRLGTSSGLATSGYITSGGYWGSSTNMATFTTSWGTNGLGSTAYYGNGVWNFWKMGGANNWYAKGIVAPNTSANPYSYEHQGYVELGGTMDRVGFLTRSGNFAGGTIFVSYMEP